jgi:cytochrome P450
VVGHLHHLAFVGALPHRAMRDLARRLGPLMLLRLGELRVVVASSADAAREVMRTHDLAFATRPLSPTAMALLGDGSLGLVFAPYGDGWRQMRRLCTAELLSARRVRSFRVVREDEVCRLLRSVAAKASPVRQQKQQALVDLSEMVLVNAWAIGKDPRHWDAPEQFSPERFEGVGVVDFRGTDFEFIPFGAGRRMCPGIAFGLANMDLALASLLYHFDWALPDGVEPGELDMTEAPGITARRLSHLLLAPTVRVPLQGE